MAHHHTLSEEVLSLYLAENLRLPLNESDKIARDVMAGHAHALAMKQKTFFGDITAQGNDGNWHNVSEWLTGFTGQ